MVWWRRRGGGGGGGGVGGGVGSGRRRSRRGGITRYNNHSNTNKRPLRLVASFRVILRCKVWVCGPRP